MKKVWVRAGVGIAAIIFTTLLIEPMAARAIELPPLIAQGDSRPSGWESLTAQTDGTAMVVVSTRLTGSTSQNETGMAVYDANNFYLFRFTFSVNRLESQVVMDQDFTTDAPDHYELYIQRSGEPGMGFDYFIDPRGVAQTYKIVLWGVGPDAVWGWAVQVWTASQLAIISTEAPTSAIFVLATSAVSRMSKRSTGTSGHAQTLIAISHSLRRTR